MLHFPDSKRAGTQLWSNFLVFALIAALCVEIDALEYLEAEVLGSASWASWVVNAIVGVQIPLFSAMFLGAAKALTEAENYQTETAFLDALALKCCYFEFFNHYGALFYQGFVKQHTYGCANNCCMDQMSELLLVILMVKIVLAIYGVLEPLAAKWYREFKDADSIRQMESMKQQVGRSVGR